MSSWLAAHFFSGNPSCTGREILFAARWPPIRYLLRSLRHLYKYRGVVRWHVGIENLRRRRADEIRIAKNGAHARPYVTVFRRFVNFISGIVPLKNVLKIAVLRMNENVLTVHLLDVMSIAVPVPAKKNISDFLTDRKFEKILDAH